MFRMWLRALSLSSQKRVSLVPLASLAFIFKLKKASTRIAMQPFAI
jgi:hypothetical protein